MKNLKLLTAAALLFAAAGAYAGTDDGNVQANQSAATSQSQAPAPSAAAADNTQIIDSGIVSPNP